jgi:hypothetical protein
MSVISRGVRTFGAIFLIAGLWVGAGRGNAADTSKQLQPVPEPSNSSTSAAPSNAAPMMTEAGEDEPAEGCGSGCGLPLVSFPGRFWLRADYLSWWTNGMNLPPLVTTSDPGTSRGDAGVLGLSSTHILYGDATVNNGMQSGVHTTLGMWIDACHLWGIEFDYLTLGQPTSNFFANSTGGDILTRPYFNLNPNVSDVGKEDAELVAYPGVAYGYIQVMANSYFQSAGVTLTRHLCSCEACCDPCDSCNDSCCQTSCCMPLPQGCRTDLLVGLRYYGLSDNVMIHENVTEIDLPPPTAAATSDIHDNFHANNVFYGSEIGLRSSFYRRRWSASITAAIALGINQQSVSIAGQTTAPSGQVYNSGILASNPNNTGTFTRDLFTMIPQLGVEVGYQLTNSWRAYVGYNVVYWGDVYRSADQIELVADSRNFQPQPAGYPFPTFPNRTSPFWAQGINLGLECRF